MKTVSLQPILLSTFMNQTRTRVPSYMTDKAGLIGLISFTAIFAMVFVNIYRPFESSGWYDVSDLKYFLFSGVLVLTGIVVLTVSRIIMYYYAKHHDFFAIQYMFWVFVEWVFLSLFYTAYTIYAQVHIKNADIALTDVIMYFKRSLLNTTLTMVIPYALSIMFLALKDMIKKYKILEENLRQAQAKQSPVVEIEEENNPNDNSVVVFTDSKGEFRISIAFDNIVYIESANNYVIIRYINKNQLSSFILRNSLKNIVQQLAGTPITRCHRSYMVNFEHVQVLRRDKGEIWLEMDVDGVENLPVSSSYNKVASESFVKFSGKN